MKKHLLIFALLFSAFSTTAQTVPSDCTTLDSINVNYLEDAQRLAVQKIHRQSLTYKDSVTIPQSHIDTVFRALIAVYNATALPARDTVVSMLQVHTFPDPIMNRFTVAADSTLPWMQELQVGNIPTGNTTVDDLILSYNLTNYTYNKFTNQYAWHQLEFTTDLNYNLVPLTALFSDIPQVQFSVLDFQIGDGNSISDSIYSDHVELIYSYAWGDCTGGCTNRRYWKFKVYFDCSVEYVGDYGSPIDFLNVEEFDKEQISVHPNPFSNKITVKGFDGPFEYSIANILGQQIMEGKSMDGVIENIEVLDEHIYFLTVHANEHSQTFKIYKHN